MPPSRHWQLNKSSQEEKRNNGKRGTCATLAELEGCTAPSIHACACRTERGVAWRGDADSMRVSPGLVPTPTCKPAPPVQYIFGNVTTGDMRGCCVAAEGGRRERRN